MYLVGTSARCSSSPLCFLSICEAGWACSLGYLPWLPVYSGSLLRKCRPSRGIVPGGRAPVHPGSIYGVQGLCMADGPAVFRAAGPGILEAFLVVGPGGDQPVCLRQGCLECCRRWKRWLSCPDPGVDGHTGLRSGSLGWYSLPARPVG
jgi:hypothetical protein